MPSPDMRAFWDERARENAAYYVDNRLDYASPDMDRFWAGGEEDLATVLEAGRVELDSSDVLVEIGCGMGRVTRALASRVARVIALDVSGEMLGRARAQNPGLANVSWTLGDGRSLASIEDGEASVCFSHVVFQHIPDPSVTLGYVREMGRVLQPGGWAAFVVSTDPAVHRPRRRARLRRMLRPPGPEEQDDLAWMGAAVDLHSLRAAAEAGGMQIERIVNEGEQFCLVIARRGP